LGVMTAVPIAKNIPPIQDTDCLLGLITKTSLNEMKAGKLWTHISSESAHMKSCPSTCLCRVSFDN
jgi:hypothetical protein